MNKHIKNLVKIHFDDIPYSQDAIKAQDDIENALQKEYEDLSANSSKSNAMDTVIEKYGTLSAMASLAGYSEEDAKKWRESGEAKELKQTRKEIFSQRRRIYFMSFFAVIGLVSLIEFAFMLGFYIVTALIDAGIVYLIYRKFARLEKQYKSDKYDNEAFIYLRSLSDKYAKRRINGTALLIASITIFVLSELSFFFFGNSKSAELMESLFVNIAFIEIPMFLCVKNRLCFHLIQRRIHMTDIKKYNKHLIGVAAFSAVYWLGVVLYTVIKKDTLSYPANIFIITGIVFALFILLYNLILRKKITYKNIVRNKIRITAAVVAVALVGGYSFLQKDTWYTQPFINSTPIVQHNEHKIAYNDKTGVYTITSSTNDFKILHLTDIHLGGSLYSYRKDIKALKAVYAEIAYTKPDLVVVTGDLSFPLGIMSMSLNNSAPVNQFAAFMRNIDIPWAFTYGNHDTESLASTSESDLNEVYKSLSYKTSGNLLYPYVQPDVMGRSNQLIEVRNTDGTLNTALFLIDSNAYTGEGINVYDYIHDDQVDWYAKEIERLNKDEGHTVSSMAFFHIPLQQYKTAYELYEKGSDEVKYFFGENGETMINKVCCSDYPSSLFDRMLELDSTKAVFCGHDHYNNMSLEYKGIRLTYGMSIDYLAMPGIEHDTKQRGAELITLHSDSSWELEQIPLTSITDDSGNILDKWMSGIRQFSFYNGN